MKKKLFLLLIFFIFSFVSCVSNSQLHTVFVTEAQNGNYELAYTNIQDAPKNLYSSYDDVLKMLDLGLLAHYSGLNQESVNYLNQAENLIYEKYSKIRDRKGFTDFSVAKEANIPPASIYDWKNGRSKPKIDKIVKIAKALDVPIEELMEN